MHLGEADVAARGELGELGSALELPLGGVRVRVRVRVGERLGLGLGLATPTPTPNPNPNTSPNPNLGEARDVAAIAQLRLLLVDQPV